MLKSIQGVSSTLTDTNECHSADEDFNKVSSFFRKYIPVYNVALPLCKAYSAVGPWLFGPVGRHQIFKELLPHCYVQGEPKLLGGAEDLALLFSILCLGSLAHTDCYVLTQNCVCDHYRSLSEQALVLYQGSESLVYAQTLAHLAFYDRVKTGNNTGLMERAWKAAFSIGSYQDFQDWTAPSVELDKRRLLCWNLAVDDALQSLAYGRPSPFFRDLMRNFPVEMMKICDRKDNGDCDFKSWRAVFGALLFQLVKLNPRPLSNDRLMRSMDFKLRDIVLPAFAPSSQPQGFDFVETLAHCLPRNYKQIATMYLHMKRFEIAIRMKPCDPSSSKYAESFFTGYRAVFDFLDSTCLQFNAFPAQISRLWDFWTHAFSAMVMLYFVARSGPRCPMAPEVLLKLKSAFSVFEAAAGYGGRVASLLPAVQRVYRQAQDEYAQGGYSPSHNHEDDDTGDENMHRSESEDEDSNEDEDDSCDENTTDSYVEDDGEPGYDCVNDGHDCNLYGRSGDGRGQEPVMSPTTHLAAPSCLMASSKVTNTGAAVHRGYDKPQDPIPRTHVLQGHLDSEGSSYSGGFIGSASLDMTGSQRIASSPKTWKAACPIRSKYPSGILPTGRLPKGVAKGPADPIPSACTPKAIGTDSAGQMPLVHTTFKTVTTSSAGPLGAETKATNQSCGLFSGVRTAESTRSPSGSSLVADAFKFTSPSMNAKPKDDCNSAFITNTSGPSRTADNSRAIEDHLELGGTDVNEILTALLQQPLADTTSMASNECCSHWEKLFSFFSQDNGLARVGTETQAVGSTKEGIHLGNFDSVQSSSSALGADKMNEVGFFEWS
ncbi:uncharacterized protein ARMOST_11899 [Armillaria ostoyae]|uniref:Transcription factor domain-containing protein n=1 Tax=Armillaria ostoyae TaxID=47428 RepID=A0A284RIG0_ARMOS|nr:uncharacterized protein ARMOST_11899 [Armillaria ostoyae]